MAQVFVFIVVGAKHTEQWHNGFFLVQLAEGDRRKEPRPFVGIGQQTDQGAGGFLGLSIAEDFRRLRPDFRFAVLEQRQERGDGLLRTRKLAESPNPMQSRN